MSSSGGIFSQRSARLNFSEGGFQGLLGGLLVVVRLEIQPHIGGPAEVAFEHTFRTCSASILA
jgi:hypothetical protein